MPNRNIDIEVNKIFHPTASSKEVALISAWICGHFKGTHLKIMDIRKSSTLADYFVLVDARNTVQAHSMANELSRQFKRLKLPRLSQEGTREGQWILLDVGSVIVHIFVEPMREHYQLDNLYAQAQPVPIPQEYYTTDSHTLEKNDALDYF